MNIIPHKHLCELKLFYPNTWEDNCPLNGELSETQDECEECLHFITVNFSPDNPLCITGVIRADDFSVNR